MNTNAKLSCWEHFDHDADIGIRGIAPTLAQAFEQAALAMTAVITDPSRVLASKVVGITCQAPGPELLLVDWINELVYEMAAHRLLFGRVPGIIIWKCGTATGEQRSFSSACHGAGRAMSRHQAMEWENADRRFGAAGIIIRSPSLRGVAEEAPLAYKDVSAVVEATHRAGLAHKVARLEPVICIKG